MADERVTDRIYDDLKQYVRLRVDSVKLAAVEGLSSIAGGAIALVLCLFLVNLALVLFTGVLVYLIDMLVGSWVWAAAILGLVYIVIGVSVFRYPTPFINRMVRVFVPMFFNDKEDDDE